MLLSCRQEVGIHRVRDTFFTISIGSVTFLRKVNNSSYLMWQLLSASYGSCPQFVHGRGLLKFSDTQRGLAQWPIIDPLSIFGISVKLDISQLVLRSPQNRRSSSVSADTGVTFLPSLVIFDSRLRNVGIQHMTRNAQCSVLSLEPACPTSNSYDIRTVLEFVHDEIC